jgi:hypothetical protein
MAKAKTWTVRVRRVAHTVEVRRKPWLAIGEIKVDGKLAAMDCFTSSNPLISPVSRVCSR